MIIDDDYYYLIKNGGRERERVIIIECDFFREKKEKMLLGGGGGVDAAARWRWRRGTVAAADGAHFDGQRSAPAAEGVVDVVVGFVVEWFVVLRRRSVVVVVVVRFTGDDAYGDAAAVEIVDGRGFGVVVVVPFEFDPFQRLLMRVRRVFLVVVVVVVVHGPFHDASHVAAVVALQEVQVALSQRCLQTGVEGFAEEGRTGRHTGTFRLDSPRS